MRLHLDWETRSVLDLRKTGVYPYAEHSETHVWCGAFALDDEEPKVWVPGDPVPQEIADNIRDLEIHAWNAQFERVIWWLIMTRRYGWPRPDREQFFDTAADAAAMALPRALDYAAKVLGLEMAKDLEGHKLMLSMAKPRKARKGEDPKKIYWRDEPEKVARLIEYCKQDVRVEREVAKRIRPLSDYERRVYVLDQLMNDRGVLIDLPLVRAAQGIVAEGMRRADEEIQELTGGEVAGVTKRDQLVRWLNVSGVGVDNIRKDTLRDLLGLEDQLPEDIRRVIEIRSESAKSSTAKLKSMQNWAASDGRARGLLLYHGAGTGRWAGKGVQPQNFPRTSYWKGTEQVQVKGIEDYIPAVVAGDYDALEVEHPALVVISALLRSCLRSAPGHRLMVGDYAQIEARVVAWIAEQDDLVEMFAQDLKIYEDMAEKIYGIPAAEVEKDSVERQIAKNSVLGCGFGMGADAFADQVKVQANVDIPRGKRDEEGQLLKGEVDEAQRVIDVYRKTYAKIRGFWKIINNTVIRAVEEPGSVQSCGRNQSIKYTFRGQFLWCVLPSGRALAYAKPRIIEQKKTWKDGSTSIIRCVSFMAMNSYTHKWQRHYGYGGLWTENVVQAMARDLIAAALLRLEAKGYRPVLSVHDEVIGEPPQGHGTLEEFIHLMSIRPRWAAGLPVAVEGWEGERYRK